MSESCDYVHHFNSTAEQCDFVKNNTNCQDASGFLNYVTVLYCNFQDDKVSGLVLLASWLAFLFVGLAEAADTFFCPNLATMSKVLRLSHNIAGITLLALGNGAADIFSSFASVSQSRPELLLGELFGAGIFISTVVAGSICIAKPFKLMERPFLRDVVFYLFAAFWTFYIFYRGEIRWSDSIGFLILYVVYLFVVVIGRCVHQNIRQQSQMLIDQEFDDQESEPSFNVFTPNMSALNHHFIETDVLSQTRESLDDSFEPPSEEENLANVELIVVERAESRLSIGWLRLGKALIPESFISSQVTCFMKIWETVKLPYFLAFNLTIPTSYCEEHFDGDRTLMDETWTQYLHVLQCIVSPQFIIFVLGYGFRDIVIDPKDKFHTWEPTLVGGLIAALSIMCLTSPENPPKWRPVFSFIGFGVSVIWIYAIANEIVALLKVFGVALGFSDAILGLTLLAWGNSISDLVADVAVARRGYPRMGFSACFGGPLFNLLLGIGLPLSMCFLKNGHEPIKVEFTPMVVVLAASLAVALLSSFIILPAKKFFAGKCHGVFLLVIYICLLATAISTEIFFKNVVL